jgi:peptidyl-tRNA hydrolase, PTH1 family
LFRWLFGFRSTANSSGDENPVMKLIVGLGNPGSRYAATRHNVGYEVIAELARRHAAGSMREKFQAEIAEASLAGEKVLLMCPLTFMNLSGQAVQPARDFYKLENSDLLVVCDDFALPVGKIRLRVRGSSGGQRGLEDIIRRCGSDDFPRLRIGIGPVPPGWDAANFVLGKFSQDEAATIAESVKRAADAVAAWLRDGLTKAMSQYNA